jgi:hypothetical protein
MKSKIQFSTTDDYREYLIAYYVGQLLANTNAEYVIRYANYLFEASRVMASAVCPPEEDNNE